MWLRLGSLAISGVMVKKCYLKLSLLPGLRISISTNHEVFVELLSVVITFYEKLITFVEFELVICFTIK
jgi:hypothetical protein